jgi:hypothetical protein
MPKQEQENEKANLVAMVKDRKREVTMATQSLAVHLSNRIRNDVVCRVLLQSISEKQQQQQHPRNKATMIEIGEGDVTSPPKPCNWRRRLKSVPIRPDQRTNLSSRSIPSRYREQSRGSALGLNDRIMPTDQFLFIVYNVVSVKLRNLMLLDLE